MMMNTLHRFVKPLLCMYCGEYWHRPMNQQDPNLHLIYQEALDWQSYVASPLPFSPLFPSGTSCEVRETTSLASSIYKGLIENGRRYSTCTFNFVKLVLTTSIDTKLYAKMWFSKWARVSTKPRPRGQDIDASSVPCDEKMFEVYETR